MYTAYGRSEQGGEARELGPWDGRRPEGGVAEKPVWVGGASAACWRGIRRSENAKVPRKAFVTGGSKVERPVKVREHTYTKSQTYCDGRKAEGRAVEEPV